MAERPTETVQPEPAETVQPEPAQSLSVVEIQIQHAINLTLTAHRLEAELAAAKASIAGLVPELAAARVKIAELEGRLKEPHEPDAG